MPQPFFIAAIGITLMFNLPRRQLVSDNHSLDTKDTTIRGEWYLQPVLASDLSTGKLPNINFDLSHKTFSGNTGCNSMKGNFRLTDSSLVFNERIITTKMVCVGYNESAFLKN